MANANWYEQFEFRLWLADPQVSALSPTARGIWFDAICAMLAQGSYKLSGTLAALARTCRCNESEMHGAIVELKTTGVADIHDARNGEIGTVTVLSRRLKRRVTAIEEERKQAKNRQKRYREAHRNAPVTPLSRQSNGTYSESESYSESENTKPPVAAQRPPRGEGGSPSWSVESGFTGIRPEHRTAWAAAYPSLDLDAQLAKAHAWLIANPTRAGKRQWARFIGNWLARAHDSGPRQTQSAFAQRETDGERTLRIMRERNATGAA